MGEYNKYTGSSIVGSPITYIPTGRFPLVGGTVFEKLVDLTDYIESSNSTAIGGSILFVVADTNPDNNGAYEILFKNTTESARVEGQIQYFVDGKSNLIANKLGGVLSGGDEDDDGDVTDIYTEKCELKKESNKQTLIFTLTNKQIYTVDVSELQYQSQATTTQDYVQIKVTTDETTKIQTITAETKTVKMEDACEADTENNIEAVDGLVTANDLKKYIKQTLDKFWEDHQAVVEYNENNNDLVITQSGLIDEQDIEEIEKFVNNNDAGTYLVN